MLQTVELIPSTNTELIFAILLVFLGTIVLGITIGQFTDLLSAIQRKEREKTEEMDII